MKLPNIKLFYSPLCPTCPRAKEVARQVAEEEKIWLEEINILSPQGEKMAQDHKVKGVPFLLVNEKHGINGIPDKSELIKLIKRDPI